jgi:hypothetical protein
MSLLASFHGYTLQPSVQVDKVASDLTTIQFIERTEGLLNNSKLVTLMELLLRGNNRYESTILMIRSVDNIRYGQAVLMLKQAEERLQNASGASHTTKTAMATRDKALFALDSTSHLRPPERPKPKSLLGRGRDPGPGGGLGRRNGESKARGKPTGGNRGLALWESNS